MIPKEEATYGRIGESGSTEDGYFARSSTAGRAGGPQIRQNKLLGPAASQVDSLMGGQAGSARPNPGDMGNSIGGMFGGNS